MASEVRTFIDGDARSTSRSTAGQVARIDRCIEGARRHADEQEARIRAAALAGCNTALDEFDLQKTHLLLAILREGRERVAQDHHLACD